MQVADMQVADMQDADMQDADMQDADMALSSTRNFLAASSDGLSQVRIELIYFPLLSFSGCLLRWLVVGRYT